MKNLKFYAMIFILFFCFAINVNAEETPFSDVSYHIPPETTVRTYSNYFVTNVYDEDSTGFSTSFLSGVTQDDVNSSVYTSNLNESNHATKNFKYGSSVNVFANYRMSKLSLMFNRAYFPFEFDKKYSLLFRFVKSKGLTYHNSKTFNFEDSAENEAFKFLFSRKGYSQAPGYNFTNTLSSFSATWHVVPDENDTSKKSNIAYLLVEFKINESDFTFDKDDYNPYILEISNFPFLIGSNDDDTDNWKINALGYFQNTQFTFSGPGSGSSGGGHGSAGGYHDNLDKVNESDVLVFDNYELCSDNDIFCHLKNIFQSIKDFFVRAGNFFVAIIDALWDGIDWLIEKIGELLKTIFIPSEDFFTSHFNALNKGLHDKLGILTYPLDLLFSVFDRFNDLSNESNGVISIPNIDIPFFGNLIKARTFKINEYWSDEPFSTLYNIYLAFVHCFIGFCLYKLALRKEEEIVGGVYSR